MPQIPMPLSEQSYRILNCNRNEYYRLINAIQDPQKQYVVNATYRLAEIEWLIGKLQKDVNEHKPPVAQEGILSLQIYMLLTCADALGHVYIQRGVWRRIEKFFLHLPDDAKQLLIDKIYTWKTNIDELMNLSIGNALANTMRFPTIEEIMNAIQNKTNEERLAAIIEFLYQRRILYTHEADFPQIGSHPNLSVMQNIEAHYPNVAILGEKDRIQIVFPDNDILVTFYVTNNVIETLMQVVLIGFGKIIRNL